MDIDSKVRQTQELLSKVEGELSQAKNLVNQLAERAVYLDARLRALFEIKQELEVPVQAAEEKADVQSISGGSVGPDKPSGPSPQGS